MAIKWLSVLSCIIHFCFPHSHICCAICEQIDADFIAQYQMNYGCGETSESATSLQYNSDYWSNPPSDVNSEEYRVWYESYCSYFYPQMGAEGAVTGSSVDTSNTVEPHTLSVSNNSSVVDSTVAESATEDAAEKPSDDTNDAAADNAGGKKRKKGKKDGAANPKPAEPPGDLLVLVSPCLPSFTLQLFFSFIIFLLLQSVSDVFKIIMR